MLGLPESLGNHGGRVLDSKKIKKVIEEQLFVNRILGVCQAGGVVLARPALDRFAAT